MLLLPFWEDFSTALQIQSMLYLLDVTQMFHTIAMFITVDLLTTFHIYIICKNVYNLPSYQISHFCLSRSIITV